MERKQVEKEVARRSALIYLPVSLAAAVLFLLVAGMAGDFSAVARVGGAVWVWLLSLIVSMPLVGSRAQRRWRGNDQA